MRSSCFPLRSRALESALEPVDELVTVRRIGAVLPGARLVPDDGRKLDAKVPCEPLAAVGENIGDVTQVVDARRVEREQILEALGGFHVSLDSMPARPSPEVST